MPPVPPASAPPEPPAWFPPAPPTAPPEPPADVPPDPPTSVPPLPPPELWPPLLAPVRAPVPAFAPVPTSPSTSVSSRSLTEVLPPQEIAATKRRECVRGRVVLLRRLRSSELACCPTLFRLILRSLSPCPGAEALERFHLSSSRKNVAKRSGDFLHRRGELLPCQEIATMAVLIAVS